MLLTTLQRSILRELVQVFLTALFVCCAILMVADMFDDRWQSCVDPVAVLYVIQWMVFAMMPEAVPTALLFATCQVFGRMRRDMEWQAVQSSGIHFSHVIFPALLLGAALTASIFGVAHTLLPMAEFGARKAVIRQGEALLYAKIRTTGFVSVPPYTIYARKVQGRELIEPIVKRSGSNGQHDLVMQARTGQLSIDIDHGVVLLESAQVLEKERQLQGTMDEVRWEIPLPDNFGVYHPQAAREMTWEHVVKRRDEYLKDEKTIEENPALTPIQRTEQLHEVRKHRRWLDVELQKRPAMAVGCLCFVLVGCGAGLYAGFGDLLSAFVGCFLPICAVHYILFICGMQWAVRFDCPPEITIWLADAVVGTVGLALLWHATRR